jgi:Uma2 family endonuclease
MLLKLEQIVVSPGQQLLLQDINWDEFETILEELGENRSARISYSRGMLEIMAPLPEHEVCKKILGTLVETLLDELGIDFWPLGSVTIKNKSMREGVEPDECYYIANSVAVRGRDRLNFETVPPPDLAIEIDITSRTAFDNYEVLGIPEFWKYDGKQLQINVLQNGKYVTTQNSYIFPQIDVFNLFPRLLLLSKTEGRARAVRELKAIAQQLRR